MHVVEGLPEDMLSERGDTHPVMAPAAATTLVQFMKQSRPSVRQSHDTSNLDQKGTVAYAPD
eukprot:11279657-Ditylum_brightwellii.AAC.1